MHQSFRNGFEKVALSGGEVAAGLGVLGLLGGMGALIGHESVVGKKLIHARQGSDYKPESFIDRHPYLTGAASLGLAPAFSTLATQAELDRENPRVRAVLKEHPIMGSAMTDI